ncbi:hypothetical protein OZ664_11635 [Elizabethkingia sp. HX WHF]|uniref:Uncharacterized protein n=1 Tax=Elizabethkingia miricola TaxID=172045 RepID=A0ABY3NAI8_ELIMR|nr:MULTISPECIES: DUF6706 family protein [Elizabethkingia]MCT4287352.1 hypothetical protein [Elizabethkingia anophelis]MDV3751202.1 hypothetical protein [Elizabethkingia anophelis]MDX8564653.1 hypothetical protein [Elizabethkingia sp. HX WHF]TYO84207.1 hypothetical protein LX74_04007 [Elizabethkingia miricola]
MNIQIRDYLTALFNGWSVDVSEEVLNVELINAGVDGSSEYNAEMKEKVQKVLYNLIPTLVLPSSIGEGGMSISYDKDKMELFYDLLCSDLNMPNKLKRNKIKDITSQW